MTNNIKYQPLDQVYPASPFIWVYPENFTTSSAETDQSSTASNQLSDFPINVQHQNDIEARHISFQVKSVGNSLCDGMDTFRESDGDAHPRPTNHSIAASMQRAHFNGMQKFSRGTIEIEERPQNERQWIEKATGYVPSQPNESTPQFVQSIKRYRLPSPNSNHRNSKGITLSWVNCRLSTDECEALKSILTRFRSNGTRFRRYFYCDVLRSLDLNTCTHILSLWMWAMGPLVPEISSSGTGSMDSERHDTRRELCYILQGSHNAKLPFLKLREALYSSGIEVQHIHEVEKLLLLREIEELEWEHDLSINSLRHTFQ